MECGEKRESLRPSPNWQKAVSVGMECEGHGWAGRCVVDPESVGGGVWLALSLWEVVCGWSESVVNGVWCLWMGYELCRSKWNVEMGQFDHLQFEVITHNNDLIFRHKLTLMILNKIMLKKGSKSLVKWLRNDWKWSLSKFESWVAAKYHFRHRKKQSNRKRKQCDYKCLNWICQKRLVVD